MHIASILGLRLHFATWEIMNPRGCRQRPSRRFSQSTFCYIGSPSGASSAFVEWLDEHNEAATHNGAPGWHVSHVEACGNRSARRKLYAPVSKARQGPLWLAVLQVILSESERSNGFAMARAATASAHLAFDARMPDHNFAAKSCA